MKTKLTKRFSKLIAVLAFLAIVSGNAFAITNSESVVSPYWQSDSGSYTFIAVSHTSLSGMASQIGLTVNAITNDNETFATAVSFTITSGTTERIFIVRTNQATINSTSISSGKFLVGTTNFEHGHIRVDPIATSPITVKDSLALTGSGYRDVTMLSFWGTVVVETNTTGFAMEFIGDMHDSAAATAFDSSAGMDVSGPAAP